MKEHIFKNFLLTLYGTKIKELPIPIVNKEKCTTKGHFLYPEINKLGKLLAVIFSDGHHDYRAMFNLQTMAFVINVL